MCLNGFGEPITVDVLRAAVMDYHLFRLSVNVRTAGRGVV